MFSRSQALRAALINHYERLGLRLSIESSVGGTPVQQYSDFTELQIKTAYRRKALECHPDVAVGHEKSSAEAEFRRISESFAILQDQSRRKEIDAELQQYFDLRTQQRRGAGRSARRAPVYEHPVGRHTEATKQEQHGDRSHMKTPFGSQPTSQDGSVWRDPKGFLWSTNPVGTGVPAYDQYIKDVEIEEGQPVSAYTSTWVTGAERQASRPKKSASATSSRRQPTTARQSFVRKDADTAFKKAFDGKSWNEVLFQMRYQGRYGNDVAADQPIQSTPKHEPAAEATPDTYKLQSPIFKGAKPAPVDEDIVRRRLEAYRRQAGGYSKYSSSDRNVTATDSSPPQPPTNSIKASPIYAKMVEYANAAYLRQEIAASWEPTAVADGGPVSFPHIAASQKVGGNIADNPEELKSAEMARSQWPDPTNLGMPYSKLLKDVTTRREANLHLKRQKEEIGYNEGQIYSYQRPY